MPGRKKNDFSSRQKALNDQIAAGSYSRSYLIYGEQAYLRIQNRDKISRAILGDGEASMNLSRFSGGDFDVNEVIELAQTLPFFADRRVIILENTALFKKSGQDSDALAAYLPQAPDTTVFIFTEKAVDKRKRLYKALQKNGDVLECDGLSEQDLTVWTAAMLKRNGLRISRQTLSLFLNKTGSDMFNIRSETEKLSSYCYSKGEVTREDVEAICSSRVQDRIFDMIEAISAGRQAQALDIYMDLLRLQTAPQVIMSLMIRQFNQLLQIREMEGVEEMNGMRRPMEMKETDLSGGRRGAGDTAGSGSDTRNRRTRRPDDREMAERLGLPPFVVSKRLRPMAARYSSRRLAAMIEDCLEADQAYKTGKIRDSLAVEMLIVQCSSGAEVGGPGDLR